MESTRQTLCQGGGALLTLEGSGVGDGCVIGVLRYMGGHDAVPTAQRERGGTAEDELMRLRVAATRADGQLAELSRMARQSVGEDEAEIFELHRMLLEDEQLMSAARSLIEDGRSAEAAICEAAERCAERLAAIEDEYLAARAADVRDVAARVAAVLRGEAELETAASGDREYDPRGTDGVEESGCILISPELTPGETLRLDRRRVVGVVSLRGSVSSHTAIIARALGLPALVGLREDGMGETADKLERAARAGAVAILDAAEGRLYVSPDDELLGRYRARQRLEADARARRLALREAPTLTRGGRRIRLYANVSGAEDAAWAVENGAEGIGLLRTELLYLGAQRCPDEPTLLAAYLDVVKTMAGRPVIIRTLDIGADKRVPYLETGADEQNPALGVRGVRLTLARPELWRPQLRAICRASAEGQVSLMLPMVTLPDEVVSCRKLLREVQDELRSAGERFDEHMPVGIMIETPSAALLAHELAGLVDFFSVGTNDLVQYTLALDRQNPALESLSRRGLEPVLRLIGTVADAAHCAGIWMGICGELAADTSLTERLLALGADELSVPPPEVLRLRERIAECD